MGITVKASNLDSEIRRLIGENMEGLYTKLEPVFRKTANEGRKILRSTSPKQTGKYARGWQYSLKMSTREGGGKLVFYNQKAGLPHLLEKGHVTRNGGRTKAYPHVAPANEQIQELFMKNVEMALGDWTLTKG